jgi:septal ring factor EnvC (AmiA/AmiB activator)
MSRWRKRLAWLTLAWIVLSPASTGAAEDISKARRDIDGITKKLNDLDAWFSDATRRQRDLQKELRSTDQSIAETSGDIREIEVQLKQIAKELADLNVQM